MKFKLAPAALILMSMVLCSCSMMFTDYKEPSFPTVGAYPDSGSFTGNELSDRYYQSFNDALLSKNVEKALENNFDIRKAFVNVEKASLNVDLTATDDHPSMNAQLGAQTKRALDYHDSTHKSSSGSFSLSYQADLFGKLKAKDESALASFEATAYEYKAMRLTVIETTAKAYWQYAFCKEAYKLGLEDLNDSQKRLELVNSKYSQGAASSLDVDDARINHLKVQTSLATRKANLQKAKSALNLMLGEAPNVEVSVGSIDDATIPEFSLDVPAKLLSRRPDLMQDAALLRQKIADYNAAKMAFFPDITLSASISSGSTDTFANFLANPIGALGAAVTFPFLNFNKLNIERKSAYKDVDIATLNFVSDYIKAVAEVYDEIANYKLHQENLVTYKNAYELSVRNYSRYFERYQTGLVALTDFLSAADTMRNAKITYLEAKLNNLNTTISLMSAIGGDNTSSISDIENKINTNN